MGFADLIPGLLEWTRSLNEVGPAPFMRAHSWAFPLIESMHLLALVTLGGCVLLTNLRIIGVGLTETPLSEIEKSVKPLIWGALFALVITGLCMSLVIAPRLYVRPGFLAKMIAFAPALILTLGIISPYARNNGQLPANTKTLASLALIVWLLSLYVFGFSRGSAPGTFHIITAGWLIAMAFGSRPTQLILGGITAAVVIGVGITTYVIYHPLDNYDIVMEINRWTMRIMAAIVTGFLIFDFARPRPANTEAPALARIISIFTILAWITVAAAGRWIGLGGSG